MYIQLIAECNHKTKGSQESVHTDSRVPQGEDLVRRPHCRILMYTRL